MKENQNENEQEIRQGLNKIEITGVVKEQKLNSDKNETGKYINGSLVIKAGEFTELEVKVFVNEKNSKGKEKKAYATLKSILDGDYQTMADGVSEEEATKVRIWSSKDEFSAQFKEEVFKPENAADVVTKISLDLGFANITVDDKITPEDYKAVFDIEMYVHKIEEEVKKVGDEEEETGRVLIKGWCPVYGGLVIPLEVIAGVVVDEEGEFDFAEQVRDGVDEGSTINIWGNIDFKSIIEKTKKGGSLGRAKVDEKRTYVNELTGIGANIVEDEELEFDPDLIEDAIAERELKIEEKRNEEKKDKKKGPGLNRGNKNKNKNKSKKNKENEDNDDDGDIPF